MCPLAEAPTAAPYAVTSWKDTLRGEVATSPKSEIAALDTVEWSPVQSQSMVEPDNAGADESQLVAKDAAPPLSGMNIAVKGGSSSV
jgi:hypothetical protein